MPGDTGEDEDETKHIHIRIDSSKKQKWERYVEENGLGTLTQLIVQAVDNTISDKWVLDSNANLSFNSEPLEEQISELTDQVLSMQSQLDEVQSPDVVDEERLTREELIPIANSAHDILAVARNDEDMRIIAENAHVIDEPRGRLTGTAEDIAEEIEESVFATRQALIWLEREQNVPVSSFIDENGMRRWYELDPDLEVSAYPDPVEDLPEFQPGHEV